MAAGSQDVLCLPCLLQICNLALCVKTSPAAKPERVDLLLHHTAAWLVHVDEAAAGVHQCLELLAAAGQLQHLLRAQVVGAQR
jgi:hypothetical protein